MTAPYGVASDAVLWLKADAFGEESTPEPGWRLAAMKLSDGGLTYPGDGARVDVWPDQSGNGNDMSEVFNIRRPEFFSNVFGSLPGVLFDSNRNCRMETAAPVMTNTDNFTMVIVLDPLVPPSTTVDRVGVCPFMNGSGGNGYGPVTEYDPAGIPSGDPRKGILLGGIAWLYSGTATDSTPHIWVLRRVSGSMSLYVDGGTPVMTTTTTPLTPTGRTRLGSHDDPGAAGFLNGYIGEAIAWDVALSDSDLNAVGNALERWGMTWTNV